MGDSPPTAPTAQAKRPTPWSVLVAAACVFAVCGWLWNELRKDAAASRADREAAAARASSSTRPQILGVDVIPQERPAPSAAPSALPSSAPASPSSSASSPAATAR